VLDFIKKKFQLALKNFMIDFILIEVN